MADGLDQCPFFPCFFSGIPVINENIDICAVDYLGYNPGPNPDTGGMIVDDVSYFEQRHTYLPTGSLDLLGHA